MVDRIHAAKRADVTTCLRCGRCGRQADVTPWEREIDEVVYRLYGLTPEEIERVEQGTP
jgi:hypothetical protein